MDDAEAIATIQVRGWDSAYRGIIPDAVLDKLSVAIATGHVRNTLSTDGSEVLVAVDAHNTVRGYCWTRAACDADLTAETAEVVAIYVDPDELRRGFGAALLSTACQRAAARHMSRVVLWVFRENSRARRFYEALGFLREGAAKTTSRWGGVPLDEVRYSRRATE